MRSRFDDIIFEGRNKEYGAYKVRKAYNRLITWSFILTSSIFTLVLCLVLFSDLFDTEPAISAGDIIATYEMMSKDDMELPTPPANNTMKQEETVLPKTDLSTQPLVVKSQLKNLPDPEKKKNEILDSTLKHGDKLLIKGDGNGTDTNVYFRVERLPEFPGGRPGLDKYLKENVRYPATAVQKKIRGVVYVCFKVSTTGRVYDVKITKSVDPDIDREAVRVVRGMPVWSPGRRHGEPVNVIQVLPIKFFLAV